MEEARAAGAGKGGYTSCMKINGVPLLPPLMTNEYRQEMLYYRRLAVAVERRLADLHGIGECRAPSVVSQCDSNENETSRCLDRSSACDMNDGDLSRQLDKSISVSGYNMNDDDASREFEESFDGLRNRKISANAPHHYGDMYLDDLDKLSDVSSHKGASKHTDKSFNDGATYRVSGNSIDGESDCQSNLLLHERSDGEMSRFVEQSLKKLSHKIKNYDNKGIDGSSNISGYETANADEVSNSTSKYKKYEVDERRLTRCINEPINISLFEAANADKSYVLYYDDSNDVKNVKSLEKSFNVSYFEGNDVPARDENSLNPVQGYESMNSQITIIDLESEQKDSSGLISNDNVSRGSSDKSVKITRHFGKNPDLKKNKSPYSSSISSFKTPEKNHSQSSSRSSRIVSKISRDNPKSTDAASKGSPKRSVTSASPRRSVVSSSPIRAKKVTPAKKEKDSPYAVRDLMLSKSTPKKREIIETPKSRRAVLVAEKNKLSPSKNVTGSLNNISSGLTSPPKLVRQNSYTLEYPSPFLMAHLEVQSLTSGVDVGSISMSESTSTGQLNSASGAKGKLWNASVAKETWSSLGSDVNSILIDSVSEAISASSKKIIKPKVDDVKESKNTSSKTSSIDKSLRNENIICPFDNISAGKIVETKDGAPNVYLDYVMKKFNEDHEKQMIALVKKQQEEQLLLQKSFESQQHMLISQLQAAFKEDTSESLSGKTKQSVTIKKAKNPIEALSSDGNSEKYLTISSEVPNKSRCLLIDRKTVKLSPTDIQCVNVIPTQGNVTSLLSDTENSGDEYCNSGRSLNSRLTKNNLNRDSDRRLDRNVKAPLNNYMRNDSIVDSNHTFYMCEELTDEPPGTGRSGNTLDDLNSTFASDDVTFVNRNRGDEKSANSSFRTEEDKAAKLKSALSKVSEIQKNLASDSLGRNPKSLHSDHVDDNYCEVENDRRISLSSIDAMPNYYVGSSGRRSLDRNSLSLNLTEVHKPSSESSHAVQHKSPREIQREIRAATLIVAYCKGYLTRRLMRTERAEATVQTIHDTLLCALQLHRDQEDIRGPDVDLHRRLIQQITSACYALHDMFIVWSTAERMAVIAQDRERRLAVALRGAHSPHARQLSATTQRILKRKLEGMSRSHSGVFSSRSSRSQYPSSAMTRSHYEPSEHMRAALRDKARRSVSVTADDYNCRKPWR